MNFSDNLKKIRKENNLSQEQLAEQLGVSRQSVSKWESNQAYPEMDKMIQLCQLFNLNIDDLLNQDIKEVNNTKQTKNNINKFIDDFLDYITKTVDMFSSMKFKQKLKCLFEQAFIAGAIALILLIIGSIILSIFGNIFSFVPSSIFYPIYNIFASSYIIFCLILGIVLLLHIFKVRYLDYYVIVKDNLKDTDKVEETKVIDNASAVISISKEKNQKILLEKKKEKIVIRDPEHSGYKFISGLLKCLLFILKTIASFILAFFCFTFVGLIVCFITSFMFIKTKIMFVGILLGLISSLIINFVILNILYNFISSKKILKIKTSICFVIALILLGIGIGFVMIGVTEFNIVDDIDSKYYTQVEKTVKMENNIFIENHYMIEYIESDNQDIKMVIKTSEFYNVYLKMNEDGYYTIHHMPKENIMENVRQVIEDLNNKKIVDYTNFEISIYTTKENIELLKKNREEYYLNQKQSQYEKKITEYESRINELENRLSELQENYAQMKY